MPKKVVTRFAPSPTGFLHIGGARTALFNWLFARANEGDFLLRIEDTDKKRSTQEAIDAILEGMKWMGLDWDGDATFQTKHEDKHRQAASQLLESGNAYRCYLSEAELQGMRETAQANNQPLKIRSPWRDRDASEAPAGIDPVIRFKAPQEGTITVNDHIQGDVTIDCSELDDLVILRSDGSPTYMLAVVVDDHEMNVTHVIRGDDHFTNTFKQKAIYEALGWDVPDFAHVPLIHGADGAKLSKRHGALGVEAYRDMGYLPEGLRNYLLRLGWSHGDDEIIPTKEAIKLFDLGHIGKSPSRFDFDKLNHINGHYLNEMENQELVNLIKPFASRITEITHQAPNEHDYNNILAAMDMLKERAKTLVELAEQSAFLVKRLPYTEKAKNMLDNGGKDVVASLINDFEALTEWKGDAIKQAAFDYAAANGLKLGKVLPAVRSGVCGTMEAPDLMGILEILGKEEVLSRLKNL